MCRGMLFRRRFVVLMFVAGLAAGEGGLGSGEQCSTCAQQPRLTALAGAEPRRLCRWGGRASGVLTGQSESSRRRRSGNWAWVRSSGPASAAVCCEAYGGLGRGSGLLCLQRRGQRRQ